MLNDERIRIAENSLKDMLGCERLEGKTFLDIGSGSGLFSLAARRLGATVRSFDYDPQSVACTTELRRRYFPNDLSWTVEQGSVLDAEYLAKLGRFDIVYSWGVLHHTGDMWAAIANVCPLAADGGKLFIAIYNDQGWRSRAWYWLKRIYCSGLPGRVFTCSLGIPYFVLVCLKEDLLQGRNPLQRYREYRRNRGMAIWTDWLDWFGGYPFEVARPEQVVEFCRHRGFDVIKMKTAGGSLANNEFVFRARSADSIAEEHP